MFIVRKWFSKSSKKFWTKRSHKKKLRHFGHCPKLWGKLFIKKRYGHVIGGGGSEGVVRRYFVLNCSACFKTYKLQYHLPAQALSEKFNFLIDQNSVRNWFCTFKLLVSKCPNYGRGGGGAHQVWASKNFASIPAMEFWTM